MKTPFDKEKIKKLEKNIEYYKEVLKHHKGDIASAKGIKTQLQWDEEELKKLKALYR